MQLKLYKKLTAWIIPDGYFIYFAALAIIKIGNIKTKIINILRPPFNYNVFYILL